MAAVHLWSKVGNVEALQHFHRAIELDPAFASAYGMAARCYSQRKAAGWAEGSAAEIAEAKSLARRAAELGGDDALALATAGIALAYVVGDLDDGVAFLDQALALNPNLAWAWLFSGYVKAWLGDAETAIEHVNCAMRLSPQDSQFFNMQAAAASAHFLAGRYGEAISSAAAAVRRHPDYVLANSVLAASAALAGQSAEAEKAAMHIREVHPRLRVSDLMEVFPVRPPDARARWAEGLRKAGIPE
jgi:tetratricopeptide (TPR) repeat protein